MTLAEPDLSSTFGEALRAPLASVMSNASALDDGTFGPLAPAQHRAVRRILAGVMRTHLLVGDMRAAADLAAGRVVARPQPLDYADVIAQTLEAFGPLAEARGVTLERGPVAPGEARLDVVLVPHVLTNLVYNAIELTPGGGTVTVRVHEQGDRLVTEVQDGGEGLGPDDLLALFSRFGELALGGSGGADRAAVGLRVARALIEAQGGEIGATSTGRGMGSTFFFALPHARA